jgi:glycerol-3-phosphate dehydrogenase
LRAYGTDTDRLLRGATSEAELGRDFGAGLTEAEVRYLMDVEWARTADDVVWRRSKLGLRLSAADIAVIDTAMRDRVGEGLAAE